MKRDEASKEALRWLRYALEDLDAAEVLFGEEDSAPRVICALSHQSAEKAIKAILIIEQIEFPKTHDLDALRNLTPMDWNLGMRHPDLSNLTAWCVLGRYPGDWPDSTRNDAVGALQTARDIVEIVSEEFTARGFRIG